MTLIQILAIIKVALIVIGFFVGLRFLSVGKVKEGGIVFVLVAALAGWVLTETRIFSGPDGESQVNTSYSPFVSDR